MHGHFEGFGFGDWLVGAEGLVGVALDDAIFLEVTDGKIVFVFLVDVVESDCCWRNSGADCLKKQSDRE